ncbi:MAG: pyridoxamine 5'-phosphate oxidase family protein [Ignavibacteria bacterium]|jgi:nitroimidazol reductase NimA-like FMN-containing flavoprotein (pyridoxamine 5'-phosphate oxidase superfamily)|nr:pyridoxamine 5'-phosphate oxidase family protein [Ignavibacteria bacterium]
MRGVIRRAEYAASESQAKEIIEKGEHGVLSTTSADGYPYGVPMSYWYKDGLIYFHCAKEGQKLDNIKADNRVSFCVIGASEVLPGDFTVNYESAVVFGKAYEVTGSEKEEAMLEMVKKFSPDFMEQGKESIKRADAKVSVYKIISEQVTGKIKNTPPKAK